MSDRRGDVVEAPIRNAGEEFTFRVEAASDDEPASDCWMYAAVAAL
jgi:hypothetical protein